MGFAVKDDEPLSVNKGQDGVFPIFHAPSHVPGTWWAPTKYMQNI